MSDPFIGEIRAWALDYAPSGWAYCDGQKLPVQQWQALFALIANVYAKTDNVTFTLPDLRGTTPMAAGAPNPTWVTQGLPTSINPGTKMGNAATTLTGNQMPSHTHQAVAAVIPDGTSMTAAPTAASFISRPVTTIGGKAGGYLDWNNTTAVPDTALHPLMIGVQGGGQAHENRQPFLTVNFCIALEGVYPLPSQ